MIRFLFCLFSLLFCFNTLSGQQKINASTFGALEARALGPGTMSGRITAIEGVNSEPRNLFIGTAGGGIWKSTNAGASFKPIFDKYCQSIGALAIDQKKPTTIYAGTGESNMRNSVSIGVGLYKSNDAGENWIKIGLDSTEHISKILLDPNNSNTVYVAAPGALWCDSPHRGLYKSIDAGKTWNKILYIDEKTGCADIAINPLNPNIIYATTWQFRRKAFSFESGGKGSALYKSEDGGTSWRKITKGLPEGDFGRIALALAPSAPENLLAIVESNNTGLFISSDAGESWKPQSATMNVVSRPFYFSTLVIDPKDPKRVYRPAFQFSYSDDGGYSFNDASYDGGWVHSDHHALWINPNNTSNMYLGTDGGVYISNDRGATWIFCQNLPVGQFYRVAVDNQNPYRIYGGLQDNGSWIGPSANPGGIGNGDWKGVYWGDGFWTVPDPLDPNIAFAESQGGNSARVDLRTFKSYSMKPQQTGNQDKMRWNWNSPIVTGANNKKNLYVASQYLFKSTDQGRNWTTISPDLSTNDKKKQEQENSGGLSADNTSAENHCTIYSVAESPLDDQVIWVGTDDGNLQLTINGGKSWTNVAANYATSGIPAQTWVSSIEASQFDINTVYVTFDNHTYGDHKTYLAKSNDMGKSWIQITNKEFTGFAHKIKEDSHNKNVLFLGTEMGLFASLDRGENWFRMKNNIPDFALVRDIQIQSRENALIIGTHGRGIYVIDDITAIRNMTKELAEQNVVLFDTKELDLTTGKYGGGSPISGGWVAGNPDDIKPFQYYLKDRLMNDDVKIDILDMEGKLIQSLPGTKRKGINKIYWNQRMKPSKVAEGGTKLDFGAFGAPKVLPGNYQVKLIVGNSSYIDTIKLVHTDRPDFSLADRKLQYDLNMKFYYMHEQLARTVSAISNQQKTILELKTKMKNKKHIAQADSYYKALEDLRSNLLATKQKSIFADEEKLRERISDAYSNVVWEELKPSNLIIERAAILQKEVDKSEMDLQLIQTKYQSKFDKTIKQEKIIRPIKS
ncbi:MAG: glycosyl hydrolase [Saprospiraceae bacterium]|nr:glycosyl hydrolase [Saprospiraceae bacterium]